MSRHLHWLPVQTRIKYKIAVLCFICVHGYAANYLVDLVGMYVVAYDQVTKLCCQFHANHQEKTLIEHL